MQITFRENIFSYLIPQRDFPLSFPTQDRTPSQHALRKKHALYAILFSSIPLPSLMGQLRKLCYSVFIHNDQCLTQLIYKLSGILSKNISITENTNYNVERSWSGSAPKASRRCSTQTLIPQVSIPFSNKDSQCVQPEKWI